MRIVIVDSEETSREVIKQAINTVVETHKIKSGCKIVGEAADGRKGCEIIVKERDITGYEDRYYRRSLMAEGTGTNCTGCPAMAETIEYTETYLLPDRMIPLAFHLNDDACNVPLYRNFFILTNDYGIFAYPYYIIDWNLTYKSTSSDAEALKHSIEASQARYAQTPGARRRNDAVGPGADGEDEKPPHAKRPNTSSAPTSWRTTSTRNSRVPTTA